MAEVSILPVVVIFPKFVVAVTLAVVDFDVIFVIVLGVVILAVVAVVVFTSLVVVGVVFFEVIVVVNLAVVVNIDVSLVEVLAVLRTVVIVDLAVAVVGVEIRVVAVGVEATVHKISSLFLKNRKRNLRCGVDCNHFLTWRTDNLHGWIHNQCSKVG